MILYNEKSDLPFEIWDSDDEFGPGDTITAQHPIELLGAYKTKEEAWEAERAMFESWIATLH